MNLDTAATTPVDAGVLKVMMPYFSQTFGNPSSLHQEGVEAKTALKQSREIIARVLAAHPDEVVFTGGGTEGDNLAIIGVAHGLLSKKKIFKPGHIITTAIEHHAVLEACKVLEKEGWTVSYIPVSNDGLVDLGALKEALRPDTVLVSVMYANNEIGTIEPLREVAKILREYRKRQGEGDSTSSNSPFVKGERLPYFHTDACQAPRFLPLSVEKLGVDLMTLNGSKIYGPKGSGCLFIKRNTFVEPIIFGGGQERGLRSGTESIPGIVGFAEALDLAARNSTEESVRLSLLRDFFINELKQLPGVIINGSLKDRLPNNINASFLGMDGEWIVFQLDARGISASTGSACSSNHQDDAHVIMALGKDRRAAESTIRFTLGRDTTKRDLEFVLSSLKEILGRSKR